MIKILNKILFHLKNIILPLLLVATIYIVVFMFKRLEKEVFGQNVIEFLQIIVPFFILIILNLINLVLKQDNVKDNVFYNFTSFLAMLTIFVFCYRALFDQNMVLWHKYGYQINFSYFSDQIAAIKLMLYGLSIANILLIIEDKIKIDNKVNK